MPGILAKTLNYFEKDLHYLQFLDSRGQRFSESFAQLLRRLTPLTELSSEPLCFEYLSINCMHSVAYPGSLWSSLVFFAVFILAFFPNLFVPVLTSPFCLLGLCRSSPGRTTDKALTPNPSAAAMSWFQKTITLPSASRGSYLVTDTIVNQLPEIKQYKVGICHLFIQHTSAALSLNENWDDDVRADMSDTLDRIVPSEGDPGTKRGLYRHSAEGRDDMPVRFRLFQLLSHPLRRANSHCRLMSSQRLLAQVSQYQSPMAS
jgi:secondary thiamine-phosphate synthase enzyme